MGLPSFEEFFTENVQPVHCFICARAPDKETAEDLTSVTFEKALRKWPPRESGDHATKAWVFQIARNVIIDHYRALKRRPTTPLDEDDPPASVDTGGNHTRDDTLLNEVHSQWDPGETDNVNALALRQAFASLSSRDQEVLSLRLAGFSNREIASQLNLSEEATAKTALRALQRLRDKLED